MANLKPCPFCGGEGHVYAIPVNRGLSPLNWVVICEKCGGRTIIETSDHDAINAWNRRGGEQTDDITNCR